MKNLERAEQGWRDSPDEFKVSVFEMFFQANIIGWNPNTRTATTYNGIVPDKNREGSNA